MPSPEDRAEKAYPPFIVDGEEVIDDEVVALRRGYLRGWKECEREPRVVTEAMVKAALRAWLKTQGDNYWATYAESLRAALEAAEKA